MTENRIEAWLRLRDARRFQADASGSAAAVDKMTAAQERAKVSGGNLASRWRGMVGGAAKLALKVGGLGVVLGGLAGIHSSIETTEQLGHTTISLAKNLGLTTEAASAWAAVAQSRGVNGRALNQSFGTLSKNIVAASEGGKAQLSVFKKLGITRKELAEDDFNTVLRKTSDGLRAMGEGQERTAASMTLFGRGWQTVTPVLRGGSKAMDENLALAKKYGVTFGGKTIESVEDFIRAQRESKFASMGLQVALGTTLIPALTKFTRGFSRFIANWRQGKGVAGDLRREITQDIGVLKELLGPIFRNKALMGNLLHVLLLVTAAVYAHAIAMKLWTVATKIATGVATAFKVAMWLVNIALDANPIGLVVIGLAALAAAFYLAYKKVAWFRHGVQAVGGWLKENWPLVLSILTGPFGAATIYIIRHWDSIVNFMKRLPGRIAHATAGMWNGVKEAFRDAVNWVIRSWNKLRLHVGIPKKIFGIKIPGGGNGITINTPDIPYLASGGVVSGAGSWITGEAGPELNTLRNGQVTVQPLMSAPAPSGTVLGGGSRPIIVKTYLDRRQIGESMGEYIDGELARA